MTDTVTFTFKADMGDSSVYLNIIEEQVLDELIIRGLDRETVRWWVETIAHVTAEIDKEE